MEERSAEERLGEAEAHKLLLEEATELQKVRCLVVARRRRECERRLKAYLFVLYCFAIRDSQSWKRNLGWDSRQQNFWRKRNGKRKISNWKRIE